MNRQPEKPKEETLPKARIKRGRSSWLLWLVPLGAAALCAWFAYRDFASSGPEITIFFNNADGLEEGNTQVKYRGANVGQVKTIALTEDHRRVKVTARLAGSARSLARAGSIFWIVRPEVNVGAISGLRTIISGEYIAVRPGSGPFTNLFTGAHKAPLVEQPQALLISLLAPSLGSVQEQTPVFYRGIQVGEVLDYRLENDARAVVLHARVWKDYAPLVRYNSQFWNAGGLSVHGGLFKGLEIGAESLKTMIGGGIEFATPPNFQLMATNGTAFVLHEKNEEKWKTWAPAINVDLTEHSTHTNGPPDMRLK